MRHTDLRYKAKLYSNAPSDRGREFILTLFTQDNTIMLYEIAPRNTGRYSSVFAKRGKAVHHKGIGGKEPSYYSLRDVFIGARITINSHDFLLTDAPNGDAFLALLCPP